MSRIQYYYDALQAAECPLAHSPAGSGTWKPAVGPGASSRLDEEDALSSVRAFPSSSRKDQDQDYPPQWRLEWAATTVRQSRLTGHLHRLQLLAAVTGSPARPKASLFEFNKT